MCNLWALSIPAYSARALHSATLAEAKETAQMILAGDKATLEWLARLNA